MTYTQRKFRELITEAYCEPGEDQHNKNINIIIDCYIADGKKTNLIQNEAYEAFAAYVQDEANFEKFYAAGVVDVE